MRNLFLAAFCLGTWSSLALAQVPVVGIYSDSLGIDCNLIDSSPGLFTAYVVVHAPIGLTAVQFAAPKPPCFTGTWLSDLSVFPVTIGSSQIGVSIGFGGCLPPPLHVLTLNFFADGTTPTCCAYPVLPEPSAGIVGFTDCGVKVIAGDGLGATFNGNASCPCDNNAPPAVPSSPSPTHRATYIRPDSKLSWESSDPENWPLTYDVYFGTDPRPPLVSADQPGNTYDPALVDKATVYYWKIVARDIKGLTTEGPVWSLITVPPEPSRLVASSQINYCGHVTTDTVTIELSIEDSPVPIDAAGIDITYDPAVLTYLSCEAGELTAAWSVFGCADLGRSIRVGGFDPAPIPVGSNGVFARLFFLSSCCSGDSAVAVSLCLESPTDDFVMLWPDCGSFSCETFLPSGDVNADGNVTPGDALCAFEGFLSFPAPPVSGCDLPGWDVRSDVDCNGQVTPGDALCIFELWLDGSCVFCGGTPVAVSQGLVDVPGVAPAEVSIGDLRFEGSEIVVPVRVGRLPALHAFGFDVTYPAGQLEYLGWEPKALSKGFERIDGRVLRAGRLRAGGYTLEPVDATAPGDLVELRFRALSDQPQGTLVIQRFVDNVAGAAVVTTELRQIGGEPPAISSYALHQNVPNPFNPVTEIRYEVPVAGHVTLAVYDVEGRLIKRLVDRLRPRGSYGARWDGRNESGQAVSSGVYFYVLRAGGEVLKKKMVFLK